MGKAWEWVRVRRGLALALGGAFISGLLVGGVLGWWKLGHGTIDWGTGGEWASGVLTATVTGAALWWAVSQFHRERQDRHRHEQRLALGELRTAIEASESTLEAITYETTARPANQAKPLEPTHPLVLAHKEARRRLDIRISDVEDMTVVIPAVEYHMQVMAFPLAQSSSTGAPFAATLVEDRRRRGAIYHRLLEAIRVARGTAV
jgi:hypothetical protein